MENNKSLVSIYHISLIYIHTHNLSSYILASYEHFFNVFFISESLLITNVTEELKFTLIIDLLIIKNNNNSRYAFSSSKIDSLHFIIIFLDSKR